jgi:uncharacterized protein (TIRG00374 family)
MNRNFGFSMLIGTTVSLIALYFAFRNIPFSDLWTYLLSINYLWIIPTIAVILIVFSLRAVRWVYILGSVHSVAFWQAFHPLMIGFMVNCILPGRVGELARPIVLNRNTMIPVSTGLATVVVERLFDLVVLLLLFMLTTAYIRIDSDISMNFGGYQLDQNVLTTVSKGMLQISGLLMSSLLLISFSKTRQILKHAVILAPGLLPFLKTETKSRLTEKICKPLVGFIDNLASGMALIKEPKRIVVCLLYSVAVWFFNALSFYIFSIGCPQIDLTIIEMTAVMVIICIAIALPSVPGYWGLWEAGGMFAMLLFGVAEKDAAGFTLANHVVQIMPVVIIGLVSAWISGVNIRRVYHEHE